MKEQNLIQFGDVADFLTEARGLDCVRVECLRINESTQYNGMVRIDTFGVAARGIDERGAVLAVFVPALRVSIMRDHDEGKEDAGWDEANLLAADLRAFFDEDGIDVRPGVIWVDHKKLMYGGWENRPLHEEGQATA